MDCLVAVFVSGKQKLESVQPAGQRNDAPLPRQKLRHRRGRVEKIKATGKSRQNEIPNPRVRGRASAKLSVDADRPGNHSASASFVANAKLIRLRGPEIGLRLVNWLDFKLYTSSSTLVCPPDHQKLDMGPSKCSIGRTFNPSNQWRHSDGHPHQVYTKRQEKNFQTTVYR